MTKILIIPDVHGRDFWKEPITHIEEYDKVIFLGDYVDPYPDEGISREKANDILDEVIELKRHNVDKVILLLGNHDLQYYIPMFRTRARYTSSHAWHLRDRFVKNHAFFKLCHFEEVAGKTYIFSHAGIHKMWYDTNKEYVGEFSEDAFNRLIMSANGVDMLMDNTFFRGGYMPSGSIVWSDVRERLGEDSKSELDEGYFQVFGHTMTTDPIITDTFAMIDVQQAFVLEDDGTIHKYEEVDNG